MGMRINEKTVAVQTSATPHRGGALRRIAVIGPTGSSLHQLRGGLIRAIAGQRHTVTCFAPEIAAADGDALDALGVEHRPLPPLPPGLLLFPERVAIAKLTEALVALRPHAVLAYGPETALRAVRAARRAKVERIVTLVSSLPVAGDARALKGIQRTLELADSAVFHNADDPKALKHQRLLPGDLPFVVVPGAGVDLVHHAVQPLPPLADGLVFLMIARLDKVKGVLDFCAAARAVKARAPSAQFRLAGVPGVGKMAVTAALIDTYRDCVTYLGPLADVRPALAGCHVYVYPSHAEGMPRSVLEAMAAGRPIITSAIAGCRDTVDERVNGVLVPPSNPVALAAAIETFLKRPDLIPAIARASRTKAERRFDERAVIATLMSELGLN
jgi:glycosyltransferase involved in cell wall biosynthesis